MPKENAIAILNLRLQEINSVTFNVQVWRNTVVSDLNEISKELRDQWLQIDFVQLDTLFRSDRIKPQDDGKNILAGIIKSYIKMVRDYSEISTNTNQSQEDNFKNKHFELLEKYNDVVRKHNNLSNLNKSFSKQNEELKSENQHLKDNTLQLDNVTLKRLWLAIVSLPTIQIVFMIGVVATIIWVSFAVGQIIEKNSANNESFDLKNYNRELRTDIKNL